MSIVASSSSKVVWFRMESCKFQPPSILSFDQFLLMSEHKRKHQNVRNPKMQLLVNGLKVQNSDRFRNMVVCSSVGSGPPIPSDPNPSSWKLWLLGMLMTVILPFWRSKWGPLLKLKQEVDTVIDTVEAVTDVVEMVAEQVEKVADEIGDHLPEGKLKDALEFVEDMAEDTAETAHLAGEFIDKVEDVVDQVENRVESFMEPANNGEEQEQEQEQAKEIKEEDKAESESQTHA